MTLKDLTEVVGILQTEVARLSRRVDVLSGNTPEQRKVRRETIEVLMNFLHGAEIQQQQHRPKQP